MPLFTCPPCRAKFESAGAPGASCPTCGKMVVPIGRGSQRPADEGAPRRRFSRRDDEYEGDYDDRPARRPCKPASTAADSLIPLLIIGGALFVILAVAGLGFLAYRAGDRTVDRDREAVVAERAEFEGEFAQGPAAVGGMPGVNPADLQPPG